MSNKTFLDIDDNLLTSKLRLPKKDEEEKEFNRIMNTLATDYEKPSVLVYPSPGICVKIKSDSGDKNFINICTNDEIPAPEELPPETFLKMIMEDDMSYLIPLSIGHERTEIDKSGAPASTYDVLINKTYFEKCLKINIFMVFTLKVIIEGVNDKFKKSLNAKEHVVLKNRKVMGKLQPHRIEKREARKPPVLAPTGPLIQELKDGTKLSNSQADEKSLEYVILRNAKVQDNCLIGLFKIPTLSANNVSVDISEDRIIVENTALNQFADIFLPNPIDQDGVKAYMDSNIGILRLHIPLRQR